MGKLAQYSLANRAAIALFTLIIAIGGVISMGSLKQELIPSISIPQVAVVTVVPGGSPEIIDSQVAVPMGRALENIAGVESVTAVSSTNVATVTLATEYGLDQIALKAEIKSVVEEVQGLPENAMDPQVIFGSTADIPVLYFTASSDASLPELSNAMTSIVIPEIQRISGVRNVALQGGLTQRIVISPDQAKAGAAGITQVEIQDALEANGTQIPAGTVTTEHDGSLAVQAGSLVTSVEDIKALPILTETGSSTIGDIAGVELVNEDPTSITRTNGQESLSLSITAVPDADVVALSHTLNDLLPELAQKAGDNTEFTIVSDQAPFIEESIKDLAIEGGLGLLFAVLVILLFLMSARSTLVTAVSIPLSVLVTFIGLNVGGYSLNMLTLGALTISIGRVVDDSIVVIENIKRHLSYGTEKKQAILVAVREVASAITASTLTTIMVFIPIAIVGGMVGELFRPFALTVAIAMSSSLLVSLTIVPVLAYWFLPQSKATKPLEEIQADAQAKEESSLLQRGYVPVLRGTQRHPIITILVSVALLGGSLALIPSLKTDFLGDTGQNAIAVMQEFDSGADLDTIDKAAKETEEALLAITGVEDVLFTVSTGADQMAAFFGGGSTTATYQVTTDPDADQVALQKTIADRLAELPLGETISAGADAMGFGSSAIDVQIMAVDDAAALDQATDQVVAALGELAHAGELENNRAELRANIQIAVDRAAAAQAGMTELQVSGFVAGMLNDISVSSIRVDNTSVQIYIDNGMKISTLTELENLVLPTPTGMVPLAEIAEIQQVDTPSTVRRVQGELSATVSITPASGELSKATSEINAALEELDLPNGVSYEIGGVSAQQTEAFEQLGLAMLIAIAIVYALMVLTFRSLIQPLILMVSVPFAAIGAIVALLVTGTALGVASLIGLLMLIGIVVTNAIVLMDLINQYRDQGQSLKDAVLHGSRQRLRPILMTAIATIFALIPMALGITGSTGFISKDLAVVVIGGLISSTALTLILVPVLYQLIEGAKERRHHKKAHVADPKVAAPTES